MCSTTCVAWTKVTISHVNYEYCYASGNREQLHEKLRQLNRLSIAWELWFFFSCPIEDVVLARRSFKQFYLTDNLLQAQRINLFNLSTLFAPKVSLRLIPELSCGTYNIYKIIYEKNFQIWFTIGSI